MILKYRQSVSQTTHALARFFGILILKLTLTACMASTPAQNAVPITLVEMPETDGTHIVAIKSTILTGAHGLPLNLLDAHFAQEQLGDGNLGPSDYRNYIYVELEPSEIAQWQSTLTPIDKPNYISPTQPLDWWPNESAFENMQFYETYQIIGHPNGWVAIDTKTNQVYIFTYTL